MRRIQNKSLTIILPALITVLSACSTLETGTLLSLASLSPEDVDPASGRVAILWPKSVTQYRPPILTTKALKNGILQIDEKIQLTLDPASEKFVPYPKTQGYLTVYKVAQSDLAIAYKAQDVGKDIARTSRIFGGADWDVTHNADFSFTIEGPVFRAFCAGSSSLDISVWVKVNATRPFQRLINDKAIDRIVKGQIKAECDNPETTIITPSKK